MIYKGKHPGKLFHGDQHPASLYSGNRLITGFRLAKKASEGRVELGTQPYKAALPSVVVQGVGRQEKLKGINLVDVGSTKPFTRYGMTSVGEGNYYRFYGTVVDDSYISSDYTDILPIPANVPVKFKVIGENFPEDFNVLAVRPGVVDNIPVLAQEGWQTVYVFDKPVVSMFFSTSLPIGKTFDIKFKILITTDLNAEWEPYCGGIPAPNPEYPIEPEFLEGAGITDGTNTANIPILRALPDGSVRDEIDLRTGTVTRRVGEVTRRSQPTRVVKSTDQFSVFNWEFRENNRPVSPNGTEIAISNHFIYEEGAYARNTTKPSISINSWGGHVYFKIPGEKTIDDFVALLDRWDEEGNPLTVWYLLATPIIEHYDPQTLRQHPGYTQLIQQGGLPAPITAEFYEEV